MNETILEVKAALEACFAEQAHLTDRWHEQEPEMPACSGECTLENMRSLALLQHYYNFRLWHVEDEARRLDVDDSVIADCKRRIDGLNQHRNDYIERLDACLVEILSPALPKDATGRQNTETVGMAVDRMSILALKIFHMEEQTRRKDVHKAHIEACARKLAVLRRQRQDLMRAVLDLISAYAAGHKVPVLYSQFKMYNDPNLNPQIYGAAKHAPSQHVLEKH